MATGLMINSIIFIIFTSVWTCHEARDTLKPGDTLNISSSLVSASGKFNLTFVVKNINGANTSYLAVLRNKQGANKAWIGNRNSPIPYTSSPLLTLDSNNTLKITHQGGDPIVIFSPPQNISTSGVVATILDSGNFVVQKVNSIDGSTKGVLWQSFDYPTDTFLPGMKLGVNHTNGYNWSLVAWAEDDNPASGSLSLDWDPIGHQLQIKLGGVVYWASGVFGDGKFQFILPDVSKQRYNFSIVSNENEDYLTYTSLDNPSDPEPEWVLYTRGDLYDFGANDTIAKAVEQNCDGYNTVGGCVRRDRQSECTAKFGDEFELKNGYFKINNNSNTSRSPNWYVNSSEDCKATCWKDCQCLGFDDQTSSSGCRFWRVDCQFIQDLTGSSNASSGYVLSSRLTTPTTSPPAKKSAHKWLRISISIAAAVLVIVLCIMGFLLRRRILSGKNRRKIQNKLLSFMNCNSPTGDPVNGHQNDHGNMGRQDLSVFSYESVLAATSNFSAANKLGEGGFGPVYKGKLEGGREIAVKTLSKCSGQGTSEFKNELILIHELQHTNLVQLFGFCIHEEDKMLIYEYMPNKSLDFFLFDAIRGVLLDWKKRFNIIEGITQGLLYLHKYSRTRVIHRDLKAGNILLDENLNPKISDFGMARIFTPNELEAKTSRIVGTRGYMPPEYVMGGKFSIKSDVYSFGVLMLEIISGRKNNSFYDDDRALNLVGYAWELWQEGAGHELMDPKLGDSYIRDQLLRCIHIGLLCVEENAADRPTMSDVLPMLTNESMQLPMPRKPAFSTERNMATAGIGTRDLTIISINGMSNSDLGGR